MNNFKFPCKDCLLLMTCSTKAGCDQINKIQYINWMSHLDNCVRECICPFCGTDRIPNCKCELCGYPKSRVGK